MKFLEFDKNELLTDFARRLPEIRKQLGIFQSELDDKVGLSRQSISSIERGIFLCHGTFSLRLCL